MTTKKKRTKKKKKTSVKNGQTLREARAEALATSNGSWPWPLRPMQQLAYDKMEEGIKRLGLFWHRRAGKDVFGMSVARNEMRKRVGSYVHFFPKHVHAKRALWRGIDPRKGAKFIDIAFGDIEVDRNNQDMMVEAYNGSTWTLLGSDNFENSVIGGNVVGVVFSEWALCDPRAWDFIRPILRENKGWAMFITTFRGRNHAWKMSQDLMHNPDWYIDIRDVTMTSELDGSRIITDEDIARERADGMDEALIQQEYFCNPEATAKGAIYGSEIDFLRSESMRHHARWNPNKPVYCIWNMDLPIHGSFIIAQEGQVLDGQTLNFTTVGEAIARSEQRGYPVQEHIIHANQSELVQLFRDMNRNPTVVRAEAPMIIGSRTSSLIQSIDIDYEACITLADALSGYARREVFDSQTAELVYSDLPARSWHAQLTHALETWACKEYNLTDSQWLSKPDYTAQDRIAKTLL